MAKTLAWRRTEKEEESVTLDTAILAQIRNGGKGRRNRTPGRPKGPRRTPRLGTRKAQGGRKGHGVADQAPGRHGVKVPGMHRELDFPTVPPRGPKVSERDT